MTNIRKIRAVDTYELRHPVLRSGHPIEHCQFDQDDAQTTIHFGYYENDKLTGIISLFKAKHPNTGLMGYQIRGMATGNESRGKGHGKALVEYAESQLKGLNIPFIWANARTSALGFYKKLGYQPCSDVFLIEGVGDHVVIEKPLQ